MPLPDARFDRVYGQEAWVHIPDKEALLSECRRVMRAGGVLVFTDIVSRQPLTSDEAAQHGRRDAVPVHRHGGALSRGRTRPPVSRSNATTTFPVAGAASSSPGSRCTARSRTRPSSASARPTTRSGIENTRRLSACTSRTSSEERWSWPRRGNERPHEGHHEPADTGFFVSSKENLRTGHRSSDTRESYSHDSVLQRFRGFIFIPRSERNSWPPRALLDRTTLVSRLGSLVAFGRRCIPPRGVTRRSNTLGILPPRALRVGRLAALDANKTSGTRH